MSTIFTPAFKNAMINTLRGSASVPASAFLTYVGYYSGAQAADPLTTPAGTFVNVSVSQNMTLNTSMSSPAGGISQLSAPKAATANATNAVTVTTARIFGSDASTAIVDTTATLSGGGGGAIPAVLLSSTGTPFLTNFLSVKLPNANGSISYNDALRDAMVSAMCVTQANIAALSSASILVYSGSMPADANAPVTGTLLWTGTTAASGASWNAPAGGSASLAANISANATATATGGYVRITKGSFVLQGNIGTAGTDFVFDSITFVNGSPFQLTNATITL